MGLSLVFGGGDDEGGGDWAIAGWQGECEAEGLRTAGYLLGMHASRQDGQV